MQKPHGLTKLSPQNTALDRLANYTLAVVNAYLRGAARDSEPLSCTFPTTDKYNGTGVAFGVAEVPAKETPIPRTAKPIGKLLNQFKFIDCSPLSKSSWAAFGDLVHTKSRSGD